MAVLGFCTFSIRKSLHINERVVIRAEKIRAMRNLGVTGFVNQPSSMVRGPVFLKGLSGFASESDDPTSAAMSRFAGVPIFHNERGWGGSGGINRLMNPTDDRV